jgi:hypothetical protein
VAVDLDVIIGCDAATLPARKDVGLVRQFSQLGTIDLGEQFGAAGAETAHPAGVEFDDKAADGGIEFRQGKEALIAQAGQDPALRDLHGDLSFGLGKRRRLQSMQVRPPKRCGSHISSIRSAATRSS